MSFPDFYRSRVLQQTYNIPQLIPGGVTIAFQFSVFLVLDLVPVPSLSGDFQTLFSEIDAIPQAPDTLSRNVPVPTISVLATSP